MCEGWGCHFSKVRQERTLERATFEPRPENGEPVSHTIRVGKDILNTQKCKCLVLRLESEWNIPRTWRRPEWLS